MPEQAAASLLFSAVGNGGRGRRAEPVLSRLKLLTSLLVGAAVGAFLHPLRIGMFFRHSPAPQHCRNMPANMPILGLVPIDQAVPDSVASSL